MKSFKVTFDKGLLKGLRQFETNPLNQESLVECFNLAPAELGLEGHEMITDFNESTLVVPVTAINDYWTQHFLEEWTSDSNDVFEDY
jgi:hypothetical protein